MVKFTIDQIRNIMDNQDRIRNMSVIAQYLLFNLASITENLL